MNFMLVDIGMALFAAALGLATWFAGHYIRKYTKHRKRLYTLTIHEKYLPVVLDAIRNFDKMWTEDGEPRVPEKGDIFIGRTGVKR